MEVHADYYDGHSARAHRVRLALDGQRLTLKGEDLDFEHPLSVLRVSEPMGAAPRLVTFPDGSHCEVRDHAGFAALLAASGQRDGLAVRLQRRWRWALLAILITGAAVAAGYRWGLPAAAEWLAFRMPERLLAHLGQGSLDLLDHALLRPSRLPEQRRQALTVAFAALSSPDPRPTYRLLFRDGGEIGANAFALPDGTLVLTDQLVALAGDDSEILAVLAHEQGHLARRHGLRMLIQASVVGIVVAWYLGDVSNVAAGLPTLLLQAGYSRELEREADAYAARQLQHNGIPPARLADLLARLEAAHGGDGAESQMDYFSTHPATAERLGVLRNAHPE